MYTFNIRITGRGQAAVNVVNAIFNRIDGLSSSNVAMVDDGGIVVHTRSVWAGVLAFHHLTKNGFKPYVVKAFSDTPVSLNSVRDRAKGGVTVLEWATRQVGRTAAHHICAVLIPKSA